jgi:hypothetical protein
MDLGNDVVGVPRVLATALLIIAPYSLTILSIRELCFIRTSLMPFLRSPVSVPQVTKLAIRDESSMKQKLISD